MSETKRDYEVGRGKPPVHSRFKKGQSGNPRGRPAKNLAALLAAALNETVTVTEDKQTPVSHQTRGGDCSGRLLPPAPEPAPEDEADGGFPLPAAARYTGAPNRRILGARMRRLATLLTLILVVVACRARAAEHKLFAWRVAGDPGTVYLLGSIHVGKPDLYPLPQPIEQAFAGSAELVEEIDMSGANLALLQQQLLQRGLYTGGDKLENHLSPTTRAALAAYLQRTGQMPAALSAMRPWLADMQILAAQLQALGFAPRYAIDQHFLDEAAAAKKPVAGLETIGFQVDLLSGLPADLQDKLVFSELVDADNLAGDATALVQAWRTGDTAGIEAAG
jgi:uncharacterized protein YbaP (TraB family)